MQSSLITFVDSVLATDQSLMSSVNPNSEIVILDPYQDGIAQITDALSQRTNVSGLHIISHGKEGGFKLGQTYYDSIAISSRTEELASWSKSLTEDADMLFYGCNIAAGELGVDFVNYLSYLTGADVAASNDLTGHSSLGGDWELEVTTGAIETSLVFQPSVVEDFKSVLPDLGNLVWTSATNAWGPVEINQSNGEQAAGDGKIITLNGVTYSKGLGTHAGSEIVYALGGNYTRFISDIGVDDESFNDGSVVFQVWADGVKIYDSGVMTGISTTKTVDVDVTGRQALRLVVTDAGDGNGRDHADWAGARLTAGSGSDTTPPTATLNASNFTTPSNSTAPYTFTVTYNDSSAVAFSSLDSNDLLVTGPNSFSQQATLVSVTPATNNAQLTATYQVAAPGGSWNPNEAGVYTIALRSNQVSDTSGNSTAAGTLGSFQVAVSTTSSTTYLSDLVWTSAANAWGPVELNKSNGEQAAGDGRILTLNGVTYSKGLGTHAGSEIVYALGGNYTRFISDIGVDDESFNGGSVVFQVWADGIKIYDSGVMTGISTTKTVDVDVTGRQALRLVVTDAGDGNGRDHADWAGARLTAGTSGSDTTPPTATLTAATLNTSIATPYTFTVTYADVSAINVATLNSNDVRVSGPNNFSQLAQFAGVTPTINSTSATATYRITAPDGIWNWNDRGTYTATLLAGEVRDTLSNTTSTDLVLGNFQVTVASTIVLGTNSSQITEGGAVTIPVQRSGDTTGTATIDYFTGGNTTATAGVNYVPIPVTTLTFAPEETLKNITVQTLNDGVAGTNKSVSLLIENPTGADLGPSRTSSIAIRDIAAPANTFTYLSDLPWTAATNGWGPVERDASNGENAAGDGKPLSLGNFIYNKGLGVHANSEINYTLGGNYNSFFAYIGVDDEVGINGSVIFQVLADGISLYTSPVMTGISNTQLVNVDVTNKQTLKLIVTNAGDGNGYDHASWANAQLVVGAYTPPPPPVFSSLPRQQVVGGLNQPTTFDWTPDGRLMFIAEKGGLVKVYDTTLGGTSPQATPFIDISSQVNNVSDRGLLGLEIDPFFGQNQGRDFIYLLFTYDPIETQSNSGAAGPDGLGNRPARLIRVTANPATNYTTALPNSEVVLLGKNSLWQYTSRPDADSTNDFSILPSGIVNGSTITAPAALVEDPDAANVGRDYKATDTNFDANNNIRDYLAGDSTSHSIGQIQFGLDGSLYVTVGDGTSYNGVDARSIRVQDVDSLSGKLLRINPLTGQGYADNPFFNQNLDSNRSKVWSLGFRNAFRFTIQPGTGTPYIGDVGWTTWEEVNVATKGGNFGWPYFEGSPQNGGYSPLPQAQAFYSTGQTVSPLLVRNHDANLNADGKPATALIMGDFYTGNTYPSIYNGALFYNDVGIGTVYATFFNADGSVRSTQVFDSLPYIVDMETGPDGNLYYASLYGGEIGRWIPA